MDRFQEFANLIIDLNRCIQRIKENEMKQFGLKASDTMCLYQLSQNDGLTATQLTELCSEDKAAISRTLKKLLEKNLVHCHIPENKRSYRTVYHLTDEGRKLSDAINERVKQALSTGGAGFSEENRENMYKVLDIVRTNLIEYIAELER